MPTYLAKSKPDSSTGLPVTVKAHSDAVSELAAEYGSRIGMTDPARAAGLCHDYGKYGPRFQDVLHGLSSGIDHAVPGAVMASGFSRRVAEAVAGHHAGLVDASYLNMVFQDVMRGDTCGLPSGKSPSLSGEKAFRSAHAAFLTDQPGFHRIAELAHGQDFILDSGQRWKDNLYKMLLERFLFSCLVDADYTVSCREDTGDMPAESSVQDGLDGCFERLDGIRNGIIAGSRADKAVNALRERVYRSCTGLDGNKSFFLLSAPTGSGKSLAMTRFALEQCRMHVGIDRAIFVLPFLTLTDQTAALAKDVFGGVLVDTSGSRDGEERKYATETWNAPCVVTTSVQFFQSLFSDRPGDCRKLHRIANSVIVFDEIQALPSALSRVCLQCLYWLTERFGCRILISTATPPRYEAIAGLDFKPEVLFDRHTGSGFSLSRTGFDMMPGPVSLDKIAGMAADIDNSCIIVNLRAHARQVYEHWKANGVRDTYFITTDLCPDHRRKIINEISERQKAGKPVHVIATQCIEAGVDLDIIHAPKDALADIIRAREYSESIQNKPRELLSERLLDECVDLHGQAERLHHLAVKLHELSMAELTRMTAELTKASTTEGTGCNFGDIHVFMLLSEYDIPLEEIAGLLGSDERIINAMNDEARYWFELAVRNMFASQVNTTDGVALTWFDARNEVHSHCREIQDLITNIQALYKEFDLWLSDYNVYDYIDSCEAKQIHECYGEDCELCVLQRSDLYKRATSLLREYDKFLTAHLDAAMRIINLLVCSKGGWPDNWTDEPDCLFSTLENDVKKYIDCPEMSAEHLRENYKLAITEDSVAPMDGRMVAKYTDIYYGVACAPPFVTNRYLEWALRAMSVTLDRPALLVKALITTIEQAKLASAARGTVRQNPTTYDFSGMMEDKDPVGDSLQCDLEDRNF